MIDTICGNTESACVSWERRGGSTYREGDSGPLLQFAGRRDQGDEDVHEQEQEQNMPNEGDQV